MALENKTDSDTMLEGRAAAFTVQVEKTLMKNLNIFKREIIDSEDGRRHAFEQIERQMVQMLD